MSALLLAFARRHWRPLALAGGVVLLFAWLAVAVHRYNAGLVAEGARQERERARDSVIARYVTAIQLLGQQRRVTYVAYQAKRTAADSLIGVVLAPPPADSPAVPIVGIATRDTTARALAYACRAALGAADEALAKCGAHADSLEAFNRFLLRPVPAVPRPSLLARAGRAALWLGAGFALGRSLPH